MVHGIYNFKITVEVLFLYVMFIKLLLWQSSSRPGLLTMELMLGKQNEENAVRIL
jgi:hypothetical protein